MKSDIHRLPHLVEILVHVVAWGIIFAFPIATMTRGGMTVQWHDYMRSLMIVASYAAVFYVNYLVLVPRLMFSNRMKECLLWNVVLIIGVTFCLHLGMDHLVHSVRFGQPHHPIGPPRPVMILRDAVSMTLVAGLSMAIQLSRRWTQMEAARHEAEQRRTEAELKNLRNQLNPHFLLNTLNNIYALIAFDADKAQQAVQDLSCLLRHVLYDNQQNFVPLCKEVDFIRNYIELMRIRLTANVSVETCFDVSPDSRTEIAPLIFISLIENAFKHGISPTASSFIRIHFSQTGNFVTCEIANSYHPKTQTDKSGSGIGLEQVRRRLELSYPGHYTWQKGVDKTGKEYRSTLTIDCNYTLKLQRK